MSRKSGPVSGVNAPAPRLTRIGALALAVAIAAPIWAILTVGEIVWRIAAP
jgi:hypothetical protein